MLSILLLLCCRVLLSGTRVIQGLRDQVMARNDKLEAMIAGIKPVLHYIGIAPPKGMTQLPSDPPA
jgi:hypothetical protein